MPNKILITRLNKAQANGDVHGAKCSLTFSGGTTMSWSGKLDDGTVYAAGEVPEGQHVVSANSDGAFAFTILSDEKLAQPVPPLSAGKPEVKRAPRKPAPIKARKNDETAQIGKHRLARNSRKTD